jgi:hypothetical protein
LNDSPNQYNPWARPNTQLATKQAHLGSICSPTMNKDSVFFEKISAPHVRGARPDDIKRLVEIDFECFQDVYEASPVDPEDVHAMMATRLGVVRELMIVGEVGGAIEGVMACQRTDRDSSEVKSWEETTNNGTLVGTHVPSGKNFYIVNLAVTKKGSEHDLSAQLIAMMLGRFVEVQGKEAQLLSRIPQFSQWLEEKQIDFDSLTPDSQDALAEQYVGTTKVVDGKERLYDGLLQRYIDVGVKPVSVLRDGYADPSSRNYEVLCTYENPLPNALKRSRMASSLAGKIICYAANYPAILNKLR